MPYAVPMDYELHDFRHAAALLKDRPVWASLRSAIEILDRAAIVGEQIDLTRSRRGAPKGGQTAINRLFARHLSVEEGWAPQPRLFRDPLCGGWTSSVTALA